MLYEGDEIKIHPFCPKRVFSASVDFDIEYEKTFYVGIAHFMLGRAPSILHYWIIFVNNASQLFVAEFFILLSLFNYSYNKIFILNFSI